MYVKFFNFIILLLSFHDKVVSSIESDVLELTSENFEEQLQNYQFLYIKFFTEKCPFSRKVAPIWVLVGNSLKNSKIQVAELECIKHKVTCEQQNVISYPTIKMFKDGKEVGVFDTDKFNVNPENFVDFAKSFVDQDPAKELIPNRKAFGKCLGR